MIFFFDNQLTPLTTNPSAVNMNSIEANTLYFVAPFSSSNMVDVQFTLPNGIITTAALMTNQGQLRGVVDAKGQEFAVWSYKLPAICTARTGRLAIQFVMTGNGAVIGSTLTAVNVNKGVARVLPEEPTSEVYTQILELLSQLVGVTFDTDGTAGLEYSVLSNGNASVVGYSGENNITKLRIPPYYLQDGVYHPVVSVIATFSLNLLKEVELPETLANLGYAGSTVNVFKNCPFIEKITIPSGVAIVGSGSVANDIQSITMLGAPPYNFKDIAYRTDTNTDEIKVFLPARIS